MKYLLLALVLLTAGCGSDGPQYITTPGLWSRAGTGDTVFSMPGNLARVEVTGTFTGTSANFILECSKPTSVFSLFVNELLGTTWGQTQYRGLLNAGGCVEVQITRSSGVAWTFTEVR